MLQTTTYFCVGESISEEIEGPPGQPGERGLPGEPVGPIVFISILFELSLLTNK